MVWLGEFGGRPSQPLRCLPGRCVLAATTTFELSVKQVQEMASEGCLPCFHIRRNELDLGG